MERIAPPRIGRRSLGTVLLAAVIIPPASAGDVEADALLISDPWFRLSDGPVRSGRAFVSVRNRAAEPDRLLYAWSLEVRTVELRETSVAGREAGVAFEGLPIPPDGSLVLSPDGPHLVLRDIAPDVGAKGEVGIGLHFARTGGIFVSFQVRPG